MRISDWSSDVCSSDLISPVEFIPVAEESGLINPLGRWAMYEAAQTLAKWDRQYGKVMPIGVSVNLSPIQMARDDVPSAVEEALRYSGVSGRRDRKSVVKGKSVSVRGDLGGRRTIKKTTDHKPTKQT